jgi:transposase-like protein
LNWHLDEMIAVIGGTRMYVWRAVDDGGEVLDILVQKKRNTAAAVKLMRKGAVRNSVREAMMMERSESSHGYREGTSGPTACRARSD